MGKFLIGFIYIERGSYYCKECKVYNMGGGHYRKYYKNKRFLKKLTLCHKCYSKYNMGVVDNG